MRVMHGCREGFLVPTLWMTGIENPASPLSRTPTGEKSALEKARQLVPRTCQPKMNKDLPKQQNQIQLKQKQMNIDQN